MYQGRDEQFKMNTDDDDTYGTFGARGPRPFPSPSAVGKTLGLGLLAIAASGVLLVSQSTGGFRSMNATTSLFSTAVPSPPRATADFEELFKSGVDTARLKEFVTALASKPHIAGSAQDYETALYTKRQFESFGIPAEITTYYPLLSKPLHQRVAIVAPAKHTVELDLNEKVYDDDACSSSPDITPPFMTYSASGNVTAPVVYVNYASPDDFHWLVEHGVKLQGKIALAQFGLITSDVKVQLVQKYGMAGLLVFSDPAMDGYTFGPVYPDGPNRPTGSVMRERAQNFAPYRGDPLSPGVGATADYAKTFSLSKGSEVLPTVPVTVIRADQAALVLASLGGKTAPESWQGALPIEGGYRVGDDGETQLQMEIQMQNEISPIWNVIGTIEGAEEPDQYVMIGNPRDAFVCGAIDSASGSAALLEIARNLGELLKSGWRPRRSIKLASWDGEEFGQIGSVEYAEDNARELRERAVSYINVLSVRGSIVRATSSPVLADFVYETAKSVPANRFFGNETETTLYEQWVNQAKHNEPPSRRVSTDNLVSTIGSNADYTGFYHHLGISSSNLVFVVSLGVTFGAFHSSMDNLAYLAKFGDPHFVTQATTAKWWGLQAIRLATEPIVPFSLKTFGTVLRSDIELLAKDATATGLTVDFDPLREAVDRLCKSITRFQMELDTIKGSLAAGEADTRQVARFNRKLVYFERQFLMEQGIPHRPWFRNAVTGSPYDEGYNAIGFPGLSDAIRFADSKMTFQRHIDDLAATINNGAKYLLQD